MLVLIVRTKLDIAVWSHRWGIQVVEAQLTDPHAVMQDNREWPAVVDLQGDLTMKTRIDESGGDVRLKPDTTEGELPTMAMVSPSMDSGAYSASTVRTKRFNVDPKTTS